MRDILHDPGPTLVCWLAVLGNRSLALEANSRRVAAKVQGAEGELRVVAIGRGMTGARSAGDPKESPFPPSRCPQTPLKPF